MANGLHFGFAVADWNAAKGEAQRIMVQSAIREESIPYSTLVSGIRSISIDAHDQRVSNLLEEIGAKEALDDRGILTAVVVHKSGDKKPGPGFFDLARRLGRDRPDSDETWINELLRVFAFWKERYLPRVGAETEFDRLPVVMPEWDGGESHPFSRSAPRFYRPEDLRDQGQGNTRRTQFFRKHLVGIFITIERPVPYAFETRNGEVRSLDAGCMKFLRNQREPEIEFVLDRGGIIRAVVPSRSVIGTYERMFDDLRTALCGSILPPLPFDLKEPPDERRKALSEIVIREGQNEFRRQLLEVWNDKCAVTKTRVNCVLEAAHIVRYMGQYTNETWNGILLRADLHRLFDNHLLAFEPKNGKLTVRVSASVNSPTYQQFNGKEIDVTSQSVLDRPHEECLEHHLKHFAQLEGER